MKQKGNTAMNEFNYKLIDDDTNETVIVKFPTKHDWRDYSDLNLIVQSCKQAMSICDKFGIRKFYLTKPGCANGRLDWESMVRPIIDDRFIIADRA